MPDLSQQQSKAMSTGFASLLIMFDEQPAKVSRTPTSEAGHVTLGTLAGSTLPTNS